MKGHEGLLKSVEVLFKTIKQGADRLIMMHQGIVDLSCAIGHDPIQLSDAISKRVSKVEATGEEMNLGGGGINAALVAHALGHRRIEFLGFMGKWEYDLLQEYPGGTNLPTTIIPSKTRINPVLEAREYTVAVVPKNGYTAEEVEKFREELGDRRTHKSDWLAFCSFSPTVIMPAVNLPGNIYLDSGYRTERAGLKLLTQFLDAQRERGRTDREIVIAANELEFANVAKEMGVKNHNRRNCARKMTDRAGVKVSLLYHSETEAAFAAPDAQLVRVPTFLLEKVNFRTNAGDTFSGGFLPTYERTHDPALSLFMGNLAAAARLTRTHRDMPDQDNVIDFLKRARLRDDNTCHQIRERVGGLKRIAA
ncbi:carbohydrate kinase family protein [Candidatus Micrarchaeota archaeon]|nr:carbohydrate kinase family protein [Candidatus Micrarchaeota archaeon]